MTVWFTGLPCSGKSTIARLVWSAVLGGVGAFSGLKAELLDGDQMRALFSPGLGFSKRDREEHIRRVGLLCQMLNRHGVMAIVAAISPYRAMRERVRGSLPCFLEVYCKCPLEVCQARDTKGLYKQALAGELGEFTGVSAPYEEPVHPEVVLATDVWTPEHCAFAVLEKILALARSEVRGLR